MAHLLYGITFGGGFVALTGEVGTGKTTLCHCLLQQIPKNVDIALILNPKLNALELLASICDELGIHYNNYKPSLKYLNDCLNQYLLAANANGQSTVLLIDEAQNLSMEVLEQTRLLTNLETNKKKLLQIILVGQPELQDLLKRQDLRQLNQRITARYHLLPLSLSETRAYIHHRLRVCNARPTLFKPSAITRIYQLSGGIPRVINILCDRALLGAYAANAAVVNAAMVNAAGREALGVSGLKARPLTVALLLLLLTIGVARVYYQPHWLNAINHLPPHPIAVINQPVIAGKEQTPVPKAPAAAEKPPSVAPVAAIKLQNLDTRPLGDAATVAPAAKAPTFLAWINQPEATLTTALTNALTSWGKPLADNHPADCHYLENTGLHCVFGSASWKDILDLNRPAILEFTLGDKQKHHAWFTGLGQDKSVIYFSGQQAFPVAEVLKYWNGYYLILEPLPVPEGTLIPGETSDTIPWLRHMMENVDAVTISVEKPRFYDDDLAARVIHFQKRHRLPADGIAGKKTIDALKKIKKAARMHPPHLEITD